MYAEQAHNAVLLHDVSDFNLTETFTCGQCFRWSKTDDGYTGAACGRALYITQNGSTITLHDITLHEYECFWQNYFDFNRDYNVVKHTLSKDDILAKAMKTGGGIHILHQDVWECLVSFIISANNNIPRIRKIIDTLCIMFGDTIVYRNKTYYSFPAPERLASLTRENLSVLRAGFRDKYILDAAQRVSDGRLPLDALQNMSTADARSALMTVCGVGRKVADCVLLFGLGRTEVFPIDVWIHRTMEHLYFGKSVTIEEIALFAQEKFGTLAGIAQQYLFYSARQN